VSEVFRRARETRFTCKSVVDRRGVEPLTSAVQRPPFHSGMVTGSTKKCRISRGIVMKPSQAMPARAKEDRAFGLQNDCRGAVSHVMAGMQEEAAEKIDAGLRAALAG
jgi:hypothetical protein